MARHLAAASSVINSTRARSAFGTIIEFADVENAKCVGCDNSEKEKGERGGVAVGAKSSTQQ